MLVGMQNRKPQANSWPFRVRWWKLSHGLVPRPLSERVGSGYKITNWGFLVPKRKLYRYSNRAWWVVSTTEICVINSGGVPELGQIIGSFQHQKYIWEWPPYMPVGMLFENVNFWVATDVRTACSVHRLWILRRTLICFILAHTCMWCFHADEVHPFPIWEPPCLGPLLHDDLSSSLYRGEKGKSIALILCWYIQPSF